MKICDVFSFVQNIVPHAFPESVTMRWLNEVEGLVQTQVLLLAPAELKPYTWPEDQDAELLAKYPHDDIYWIYLAAMVAYAQGETGAYNNHITLFNARCADYCIWYAENYRPADGKAVERGYYLSAYSIACRHGFEGTEEEWLRSLHGKDGATGATGQDGKDGMSAYEVACADGFEGTVSEWLLSLHGTDGKDGKDGKDGVQIDDTTVRMDATWSSAVLDQKFKNVAVIIKPDWKPFNQCTWEEIANIARRYDPCEYWKVGDWKPLNFIGRNGAQFMVPFVIIDFDKDSVADVRTYGKRYAGLTALLGGNRLITEQYSPWISGVYEPQKGLLPDILIEETTGNYTYGMFKCPNRVLWNGSTYVDVTAHVNAIHGEGNNATGAWWPQSGARHALQSIFDGAQDGFNADDVVAVEKVTSKYYRPALGNEFHTVTEDKVWLLSETEFWGKQYSSPAIEGEQYEYFKKGASKFFWGNKLLELSAEQIDSTKPYNLWTRSSAQEHLNDTKPTMSYSTCVKNTIYSKDADGASVGYSYGNDKYVGGYFVPGCCL